MKTREELLNLVKSNGVIYAINNVDIRDLLSAPTQEQLDCQYCHEHEFIVEGFDLNVNIYRNELFVRSENEVTTDYIKYCPMCGRKLGDGK